VVTGSTTRENFYVAMTRGRHSNVAYVALDRPDDSHAAPSPEEVTAKTILFGVLQHSRVELSAHQTITAEQEHWSSFDQLAGEYLTLAAVAQRDRWGAELSAAGLSTERTENVMASTSFGPLTAELRRAESSGYQVSFVLRKVIAQRGLEDADDIGAVLISRVRQATLGSRSGTRCRPKLIAGLVPVADGPMPPEMRRSLVERQHLLEVRATTLAVAAVAQNAAWVRKFGPVPTDPHQRDLWMREVRVVAAYRDLWRVDSDSPVGPAGASDRQRVDEARARKAVRNAADIARKERDRGSGGLTQARPILSR
jgi:hypothetical protein